MITLNSASGTGIISTTAGAKGVMASTGPFSPNSVVKVSYSFDGATSGVYAGLVAYKGNFAQSIVFPSSSLKFEVINPDPYNDINIEVAVSAFSYDTDAIAYFTALDTAGADMSVSNKNAVNTLFLGLKSNGIWSLIHELYLNAGPSAIDGVFIKAKGSGTRTNFNFLSGDYIRTTGLKGNGTTKYINNGFLASSLNINSNGLFVYGSDFEVTGNASAIGAYNNIESGLISLDIFVNYNAGTLVDGRTFRSGKYTGSQIPQYNAALTTSGSISGNRQSASLAKLYQNGLVVASNGTIVTPSFTGVNMFSFALNTLGSPGAHSTSRLAVEAITTGISDAQTLILHNLTAAYVSSLT
jgi:hypothetical protein